MPFYEIGFKPRALKDCRKIPKERLKKIFSAIDKLRDNLSGNVKHLSNFEPEYRLRVGNYRILFEIDNHNINIYRIVAKAQIT